MRRRVLAAAALMALGGCATTPKPVASVQLEAPSDGPEWRDSATPADETLIETLPAIWARVLASAKERSSTAIAAEGPLLDPGAALDHPELPPGSYFCRVVRIGKSAGHRRFIAFPPRFCYISADDASDDSVGEKGLIFAKQTGTDLPTGYLYVDGDRRYVFLGARQKRQGDTSLGYGTDAERNVVGVVERIGAFRWRLVAPREDGNTIDIYELTPVPADQQPS